MGEHDLCLLVELQSGLLWYSVVRIRCRNSWHSLPTTRLDFMYSMALTCNSITEQHQACSLEKPNVLVHGLNSKAVYSGIPPVAFGAAVAGTALQQTRLGLMYSMALIGNSITVQQSACSLEKPF